MVTGLVERFRSRQAGPDSVRRILWQGQRASLTAGAQRPSPRKATAKSLGRSPGLGFILGPAFPPKRWHVGPSSPDTVAGQRRIRTGFPYTERAAMNT
jgi:hypothetical protein